MGTPIRSTLRVACLLLATGGIWCTRVPSAGAVSVKTWTGAGDHVHWSDPANWSTHSVPIDGDDVVVHNASTVDDLAAGLHLASLSYTIGALSGSRLVVDRVIDAYRGGFKLTLVVGDGQPWALGLYESFTRIDLAGHALHVVRGPDDGLPCRCEGYLAVSAIVDSVGGGSLSLAPNVQFDLVSSSLWSGTITGGRLDVYGAWPATSYDGPSVSLFSSAQLDHLRIEPGSNGLGSSASSGFVHLGQRAQVASVTMAPGTVFNQDTSGPALAVLGPVDIAGSSLQLDPRVRATCPATIPVIDNLGTQAVAGQFNTITGYSGTPGQDPYAGRFLTAHYNAGDGNDVTVTCSLTPAAAASTNPRADESLPRTGQSDTATLTAVAIAILALGLVVVRATRRRTADFW